MPLMTDLITPAELTGYARESLAAYEARKGTLARFLPNRSVEDVVVRMVVGQNGLVDEAKFRAYGAAPEVGRYQPGKRVVLELPALGQDIPLDEYSKLRARNASDDAVIRHLTSRTDTAVRAVADAIERMRGIVLTTGKATIDQANFKSVDDFGRSVDMAPTAAVLWTAANAKVLDDLNAWADKYGEINGDKPGVMLVSTRVARLISTAPEFQLKLVDGASRAAGIDDVNSILDVQGLPRLEIFDRRTKSGRVIPEDRVYLLPAPVGTDAWEDTELGGTFWGLTESATKEGWDIAESEQPGIVVAGFEGEKPGDPTEVISDAIGLPILANANLSMVAKVA